jgi:hypothetical protein
VPGSLPGLVAAAAGLALLSTPSLALAALGIELIAAAFWSWSRLGDDRREQLARWGWLRRPAMALWLATALWLALPSGPAPSAPAPALGPIPAPALGALPGPGEQDPLAVLKALLALAVLWASLELLAALPSSRPYPDLTGPLPAAGPWLPAVLPAAGFLVLWRHAPEWSAAPWTRELAELALAATASLAVLRAFTRRSWTASLRWLAVCDSALAGLLLAFQAVPSEVAVLLWFAAGGGRLLALAAEIRGASGRRGAALASLWRLASWAAGASLAWPLLMGAAFSGGAFRVLPFVVIGAPVFLSARIAVRRLVEAPERRAIARRDPGRAVSVVAAIVTLATGPAALAMWWWGGGETSLPGALVAAVPALLGAWPLRTRGSRAGVPAVLRAPIQAGATARDFALRVFRSVVRVEQRLARVPEALLEAFGAPLRGLHTGDAQEYLLFLVGISVLALLLPLLR